MNFHNIVPNDPVCSQRRSFLSSSACGLGGIALAQLLQRDSFAVQSSQETDLHKNSLAIPGKGGELTSFHHSPKVKRIIYLFMSGGPSQLDLFDYKPELSRLHGEQLPESVRGKQRLTGMSGNQSSIPLAGSPFKFQQAGSDGWISDLLPHTRAIADKICVLRSAFTEAINHGPGVTFMQTGSQIAGRPSIGSWLSYGLGQENSSLPSFVCLITKDKSGQPLGAHLWGSGFLPAKHQGVLLRAAKDPVLYLTNPKGIDGRVRRAQLDKLREFHESDYLANPDKGILDRIQNYEMAYAMQSSIPELNDFSAETQETLDSYGPDVHKPGSFAANCLMARRLAERNVPFIQLYHQDWDHHGNLPGSIPSLCKETDQPSAALVNDLDRRGLLKDTLVVWGGEFGRTNYCQGKISDAFGRDHHPRCFSMWFAGGGIRAGTFYGQTDELGYNVVENPVHVHDIHATMLHLLGIDHEQLTYRYQGRRFRLTDVHGKLTTGILS